MYGDEKGKEYRQMFEPQPEEKNLPKVQIFDTCKAVINVIPACVHAHDSATGKKKEDVEEFNGDDPYDGFRYLLKRAHLYMKESQEIFAEKQIIGNIMSEFEQTGDYNHLYRRMEKHEHDQRKSQMLAVSPADRRHINRAH
jgi:hypothetical protein